MNALRIAMVSYYLPSDSKIGVGWQAHGMANALSAAGHHVTMFSPCPRVSTAAYEHVQIVMTGGLRTVRWAVAVRRLDLSSFDVVHAHGDDHLLAFRRRPVHVRTMHGSCFDEAMHVSGLKEKLRMAFLGVTEVMSTLVVDQVVGVSANSLRWFPWLEPRVIPNGVDRQLFSPTTEKSEAPSILFVGTYERRKRGKLVQEAFLDVVLPALPNAVLWMVCDDAPPAPHVQVLGRLSDEDLAERYRRAWVFCLPSSYEGFGVPYAEALCSGTTVVATPNLGAKEVLRDGRCGVIVQPEQVGQSLLQLLSDDTRRHRWAAEGYADSERFDWTTIVAQYEAIYAQALSSRGRSDRSTRRHRQSAL